MADPVDPIPEPTPPPAAPTPPLGTGTAASSTSTGLPSNVAASLACIPLIGGIIFLVLEKNDRFVRFYAMQSIIFGGGWVMLSIIYHIMQAIFLSLPAIGGLLAFFLSLIWAMIMIALLIVFVIAVIKAFTGVRWDIPYIGPMARAQVDGPGAGA